MENDHLKAAQEFQSKQIDYLVKGDVDGLVAACYTDDARLHGFQFRAQGRAAIKDVLTLYLQRLSTLGARTIDKFAAGKNYIWLELTIENPAGEPVKVYEVKFLRDGQIYLQLYGLRQGTVWQSGDFAGFIPPDATAAHEFHNRYLDFHSRGDADGLADDFFTLDAQLVTARVDVSGREAIRQMFRELFSKEADFTPLSVENITSDTDYVWFEATVTSTLGMRRVYDVMLVRDGEVYLQLVGQLMGVLPTEAAFGQLQNQ
ncbi:nuclear transport factor 2 family protein [Spirosoma aureum]|uniref:Nuclear transport factor 2 family protein n=1 Tax=Spirosoma aureum TaxID=2692134 RepID=A0A6G9ALW8_9BACT|nr:nuclear transport factor 2 family protein [Spirosoma aureum]QIP13203.1 nuclear transport factor 2 family protein [Spirosoma aureum]